MHHPDHHRDHGDGDLNDNDLSPEALAATTKELQRTVAEAQARPCADCGRVLCPHEGLLNVVLGSRHTARCLACLGVEHRESPQQLCERTLQWIRRRDCYLHVWQQAGIEEHGLANARPTCLFTSTDGATESRSPTAAPERQTTVAPPTADANFDAGDQGCGDLVLELRNELMAMAPRLVLRLRATDPAAPVDIPAWCGLTGHTLLHSDPPEYWIQRKESS